MVVAFYDGNDMETKRGAKIHTVGRRITDGDVVSLQVTDEFGKSALLDLDPEEAAMLAVYLLRDRSLMVNGHG